MQRFSLSKNALVCTIVFACPAGFLNPAQSQVSDAVAGANLFDLKQLRRNVYTALGPNVRGILVGGREKGVVGRFVYDCAPYGKIDAQSHEDNQGPAPTYGRNHRFVMLPVTNGGLEVAFQDVATSQLKILRIGAKHQLSALKMPLSLEEFGAITKDGSGNYYYFTKGKGQNPQALLVKADNRGQLLARTALGNGEKEFDIRRLAGSISKLCLGGNSLCFLTDRTMQSGHQGSILATFNPADLSLSKNYGQNASHSFDSRLIYDGRFFISLDLADNYPRGIKIHKVSPQEKAGKVVFTYKTQMGSRDEATRTGHQGKRLVAGRWSNDNRTYSELADVIATPRGYLVVFASETSVDNRLATSSLNESRNIGAVLVRKDFETVEQKQSVVNEALILSRGQSSQPFGFYDYGGEYVAQKNTGVMWLTDYRDKEKATAARPKTLALGEGRYLVMWEKWTNQKFLTTQALAFDESGQALSRVIDLGAAVRLSRSDHPVLYRRQIIWPTFAEDKLTINVWNLDNLNASLKPDAAPSNKTEADETELPVSVLQPRAGEIMLEGIVQLVASDGKTLALSATQFTLSGTAPHAMSKAKSKAVFLSTATVHSRFGILRAGQRVQVVGRDSGTGTPLTAREILVLGAAREP